MELTGEMYSFYSNRAITAVFEELKKFAESIQFQFEYSSYEDEEDLFFFKDENMLRYHEENGYNTDLNGEGCFSIEATKEKLNGVAKLLETKNGTNFDPYYIKLTFSEVYSYLLTVPHFEQEDEFSRKIHDAVIDILTKD